MRKILLILIFFPTIGYAQVALPYPVPPTYRIGWDHPNPAEVVRFESRLDSEAFVSIGKVLCDASDSDTFCQPFPAVTPGSHKFEVRACAQNLCSAAAPLDFTVEVIPATPTGTRIIPPVGN